MVKFCFVFFWFVLPALIIPTITSNSILITRKGQREKYKNVTDTTNSIILKTENFETSFLFIVLLKGKKNQTVRQDLDSFILAVN